MTLTLFDTIQRIVREEVSKVRTAELGVVEEQHPHASESDQDNYACTVRLRDSGIVLRRVPVATPRIGGVSIPAVGDLVIVQFLGGDINAPVITGSLYNDQDRPPANRDGQAILHLPLGAGDSDAVHIEMTSGDVREIVVNLGNGMALNIKDDDPVVKLDVDGGKATITVGRDGAITLESQGNIEVKGGGNISVEAQGQLNLKGSVVNIN
jgi:uncharacterized protein involved in type VI secretion and phage assembly